MAEFVTQSVAQIKNELDAVKFLTLDEKRKILKKQERLEYRIRKRQKKEADFLMYIQYCKDVLQFFKMRKKINGIQSKADIPVIKRIHQLYQLCETRFPQSTDVWLQHIQFSTQQKDFRRVSRLYQQMLKTHSTQPDLWAKAAAWEVDHFKVADARSLMQQCVSTNKTSVLAWTEYYRLELMIIKKMKKVSHKVDESDPTMSGKLARLVKKHACHNIPESPKLLQSLIEVTDKFPFAYNAGKEMLADLKKAFSGVPSVRDFIARRALLTKKNNEPQQQEERFFYLYDRAVAQIPTSEMWTLYLEAGMELLSAPAIDASHLQKRVERVLKMFQRAADTQCLTEDMFPHWLTLLRQGEGSAGQTQAVCEEMVRRFPHSVEGWCQRLHLLCTSLAAPDDVLHCVNSAAKVLPDSDMWSVWRPALMYLTATNCENLESIMERPCLSFSHQLGTPARLFCLRWTALNKDIRASRDCFNRLYIHKPVTAEFYLEYIKQELMENKVDMERVRTAFEHAISDHGKTDPELWLRYAEVESTYGDMLLSSRVGSRALVHLPQGPLQEAFLLHRAGLSGTGGLGA